MVEALERTLCTLAYCWRLERRDGVTIGLTGHDRDLVVAGVVYAAAPGMLPSAVSRAGGLETDSMDVKGALTAAAIRADDLSAGLWDGAALALYLTDWETPGTPWLELARGELGAVEREGDAFTAELRGPAAALEAPFAPLTSPGCRAMLGDRACRIDLARHSRRVVVGGVVEDRVNVAGGLVPGRYAFGSLRWLEGRNVGVTQVVLASDAGGVTLADPLPFAVETGTRALLTEGCDKRLATCSTRFANAANFRGEPFLPGTDLLTRYPGAP